MQKQMLYLLLFFFLSQVPVNAYSLERLEFSKESYGRYQGKFVKSNIIKEVIAEFSLQKTSRTEESAKIELVEVKGSSRPHYILLRFKKTSYRAGLFGSKLKYTGLTLSSPLLGSKEHSLTIKDDCGQDESVKMCFGPTQIKLTYVAQEEGNIEIILTKGDQLSPLAEGPGEDQKFSLDEFMGRAKYANYSVQQEAQRVFQARQRIRVSIGNLLPRFNLGILLNYATGGPLGLVDSIGNLLPFIFPSNWFNWKESKRLYQAERKSFASLRGNEMNGVEGLFYLIQRDSQVLKILGQYITWLEKIHAGILKEEEARVLPIGSAKFFENTISLIEQDYVTLSTLIDDELKIMAQSIGLRPLESIKGPDDLKFTQLPDLTNIPKIDPKSFASLAQERSFEIASLKQLIEASRYGNRSRLFSFLNPSSGGSIGFGTPATIAIGRSQIVEIQKRMEETFGLIEVKSVEAANQHNKTIDLYRLTQKTINSKKARFEQLVQRHLIGDPFLNEFDYLEELSELSREMIEAESQKLTSIHSHLIAKGKIDRLLLQGFYSNLEGVTPANKMIGEEN